MQRQAGGLEPGPPEESQKDPRFIELHKWVQVQVGAVGGIVQAPGSQFNDFRVDFPWSLPIKPVSFTARFSYRGFICSGFRLVKRQLVQDDFYLGDSSGHFSCGFHLYCCSTVVEISVCPRNETHFVGI